jgi:hypothetical protein
MFLEFRTLKVGLEASLKCLAYSHRVVRRSQQLAQGVKRWPAVARAGRSQARSISHMEARRRLDVMSKLAKQSIAIFTPDLLEPMLVGI